MAKQVFRPNEIKVKEIEKKFSLPLIHDFAPPPVEEKVEEVVYDGPTADDIRKEAEAFKKGWEIEKQHMMEEAQKQAADIVSKAQDEALAISQKQTEETETARKNAEDQAAQIIEDAKKEAEQIVQTAHAEEEKIRSEAIEKGFAQGHEDGLKSGEDEINRLTERMRRMLEAIMNRREEILRETEQQIVELVILMTRKVVKIISETQKTTVVSNVIAALKKVKTRGNVVLHVNTEDLKIASANVAEFIKRIENIQGITVMEDSSVEKGGCIVETDFGAIDARIASQLGELESKILEVSPVKSISKTPSVSE
ncbi:MAG: flagellar assembly protein FliH [Treponema sp.]|nr:flagellar assembly protein FliH [Treponema sp.]